MIELEVIGTEPVELEVIMSSGVPIENQDKTVTPSGTEQSVTADPGYTGLGTVTVEGIDPDYVGSDIPRRSSADLTASGASVSVPAGYYENSASKSVSSGSAGTPTATKGAVSGNAISITPSVLNYAGYITGGTKTGSAVTVEASELVSGTKEITANGTEDVTNYALVSVNVGGGTPSITSLSANYTQSGAVDVTDSLYTLIPDLIVTATINNSLVIEIASTDYTLSGTLTVGTSTITVSYGGLTTTFTVIVTSKYAFYWDYTYGVMPVGWTFTTSGAGAYQLTADGIELTSGSGSSDYVYLSYFLYTHATLSVIFSMNVVPTGGNGARIGISDGTNGAQTCATNGFIRTLNTVPSSNATILASISTGVEYKVSVTYNANTGKTAYSVNDTLIRDDINASSILYATRTAIWSQQTGGKVLVKHIELIDHSQG